MSFLRNNNPKIKSQNWDVAKIKVRSYDELKSEATMILNSKKCTCGANSDGVDELLISGSSHLMVPDINNSCDKCGGTGLIQK